MNNQKMKPKVSIIVINWNGWEDTIECLESLSQINYPNYDVVIIDNGSQDQSIQKIREYTQGKLHVNSEFFKFNPNNKPLNLIEVTQKKLQSKNLLNKKQTSKNFILIKNKKNLGFAAGNNVGIIFAKKNLNPEYILLLNNDTTVEKFFLDKLIKEALKNSQIGVLGPKIYYYNDKNRIQSNGGYINFWLGRSHLIDKEIFLEGKKSFDVDFVLGAALLFKSALVDELGLFYTPYFAYWEETDWCTRAKKFGYRIVSVPEAIIWHKGSSSIKDYDPYRIYLILRNNIIFMRRNAAKFYLPSFYIFHILFRIPSFLIYAIQHNSNQNHFKLIYMVIKGFLDGIKSEIN